MSCTASGREKTLDTLYYFASFLFGLVFGSFGNVVIWRLPRGESLSVPSSHCPGCETPIAWYDNIPLLSWFVLLGRCRSCAAPIPVRYPLVELLSGLLWMAAALRFGPTVQAAAAVVFFYVLLLLAFIDIDTQRLPNSLVGFLAVVGLLGIAAAQVTGVPVVPLTTAGTGLLASPTVSGLAGAVLSAGLVLLFAVAYALVRGVLGFGMGDIKLLAVLGLFLGPYGLLVLFVGSTMGAVYGLVVSRKAADGMRHKFPFGPFLAMAAIVVALAGEEVVAWYLRVLQGVG